MANELFLMNYGELTLTIYVSFKDIISNLLCEVSNCYLFSGYVYISEDSRKCIPLDNEPALHCLGL